MEKHDAALIERRVVLDQPASAEDYLKNPTLP